MDKKEAIKLVKAYKQLLKNYLPLGNVYLFGSWAKGTNREDSDIDVAIVIKKAEDDFFLVNPLLWKIRRQIDLRIEPVLIETDYDDAGFLEEIQKYGIEIA